LRRIALAYLIFVFTGFTASAQCPVNADFNFNRLCNNGLVHFTDSSYLTGVGQIVGWEWNFGDGAPLSNVQNPTHNYVVGATYNVQLVVTDSSGCTDTIIIPVFVNPLPSASFTFGPNNACSGSTVSFNNTSTGTGLTYLWNFGDGNTSTLQNPSHIYTAYGCGTQNFNATLTVTDANGCSSTITQVVSVLQQPNVFYFEPNGFIFCHTDTSSVSDTMQIFNFSPDAACIASYTIDWGDGSPLSVSPPALFDGTNPLGHIYTSIGYFPVTITAVGTNGCQTVYTQTATVESNPVASLIGPPVGSNVGCAPFSVCVVNMSQNISPSTLMTLAWGDGITDTLPTGSVGDTLCHNYLVSGCIAGTMTSYTVTLTSQNICDFSQSSWSPVRIYEPPDADFYLVDDSVCVGENAVIINQSEPNYCAANSATWYTWDFGDGTTFGPTLVPAGSNPQQTINHIYGDTGVYVITLTANNSSTNGCGSTQFQALVWVSQAYAQFSFDTVCMGDPTHFTDSSWGVASTIISWEWHFGDGGTSNAQNPNHIYPTWGDFNAWLAVTSSAGCTDTMWHIVHVDTLPYVEFAYDTVCFGDPTHFTNLSYGRGSPIFAYLWDFGDGNTSSVLDPVHTYGAPGNYNVTLIVTDDNGCIDSITHTVPVSPPPIPDFSADTACLGSATQFTDQSTAPFGSIVSWDWDFGDGSGTSNAQNPAYIYGDTGTYWVTLIVETNIGCTDTVVLPVYVSPIPEAGFFADTVCAGGPTHFTDTSQTFGWPIVSWQWDFGDGGTSNLQNPIYTYPSPGQYIATLVVSNPFGCSDTVSVTIVVDSIPEANFIVSNACLGDTVCFTDNSIAHGSPIVSWEWDFGDTQTAVGPNPCHLYAGAGTYNVSLVVTSAIGCTDTIVIPLTIYPLPEAGFTFVSACNGDPVMFTDTSHANGGTIVSWEWDFGDGSGTSNQQNPQYFYGDTGTYFVTLIVFNSNGCTDTVVNPINYLPRPTAEFLYDTSCAGQPIHFTDISTGNGSTITSWEWDFGDGNSSILQNPVHPYANSGTFVVTLIVSNSSGCADTIQHNVIADSLPEPLFTAPPVCFGDSTYFTDLSVPHGSAIASWQWDFGDGNTSTLPNPVHLYAAPGVYPVTLVVENTNGCSDTLVQNITVYALPTAAFNYTGTCLNRDIFFTDNSVPGSGTINTWDWDFGDGSGTSAAQNPIYQYSIVDSFLVTLIVIDQYGCTDTISDSIRVSPLPVSGFMADSVCLGLPTHFADTSQNFGFAINFWEYNFGDGNSSNLQNPDHIYGNSGNFNVQLVVGNTSNCFDTVQQVVFVKPTPTAQFAFTDVCFADTTVFTDNSVPNSPSMLSWDWDFGDGNGSNATDTSHLYGAPGNYPVQLIVVNSWNCSDTLTQNVTVYSLPQAGFMSSVACIGFPTSFVDTSNAGSGTINGWDWDFGEPGGTSIVQDPTYTYTSGGTNYTVTLAIVDQYGCTDTTSTNISLHPQPVVDFSATAACSGLPNNFTDLSVPAAGVMASWDWDFGDGSGTSAAQNPSYIYPATGVVQTYTVTLIGFDNNGCPDTTSHVVTVNPNPVAGFTSDTACVGDPTTFADISTPLAGAISSWDWDFGDGSGTSAAQNPTYIYPASPNIEIYNSILMVEDANGCRDTITHAIRVNPLPVVWFGTNTACTGSNTLFTDSTYSNGGALNSWTWDFGDGTGSSAVQNPAYTYDTVLNPTVYNVNLLITDINGCVHDTLLPVSVNPLPIASFNSISACSGYPSQFTDASTSTGGNIVTWNWDFGDGSGTSVAQNPTYLYPTTSAVTTYNVVLGVTDQNGCFDTIVLPATIYPSPSAGFISDSVCSGTLLQFTDTSSSIGGAITSWNWDFGDGSGTSAAQNPAYTYPTVLNTTPYPVTLIVENVNGCFDTTVYNALIWPNPVVDFHTDIACFGNLTHFYDDTYSNGAALQSWSWDFGDGSGTSALQYPDYLYGTWGSFNVNLTVIDSNLCTSSATNVVVVDSLPIPDFTFSISCTQGIVQFTNNSQPNGSIITGYLWDFDDLSMSGQVDPAHYFTPTGTYDVTLFVNNNRGCSDSVTYPVVIAAGLEWDFTATTECVGEATVFNDFAVNPNVPAVGWFWNFGDGTSSTLEDPTHLYLVSGTYNVLLTVTDAAGCTYSVMHNVVVNPAPTANFSSTIVTQGNPTTFTDLSTTILGFISAWQWDFGDGSGTSNQQNPLYTYAGPGTYNVTLIAFNNFGCSDTITLPATVLPLVDAEFTFDTVCAQTPTTFLEFCVTGAGTIDFWYWDFGDGYSSNLQNPQHTFVNSGVFTVTLIATNTAGISDTVSHQVLVLEAPNAQFLSTSVCEGNATAFMNQSTGTLSNVIGWSWDLGDGDNEYIPSFSHIYDSAGIYNATLVVVNTLGCTDTISQLVHVWELPQVDISAIPQEGCLPLDVVFTDLTTVGDGTITSWMWQFGDGFTSVAAGGAFHQYTAPGLYDITLTVTSNHGCTTTQTFMNYIQVWPNPIASFFFTPTNPSLSNPGVNFHDISVGASNWYWDFGDFEYSTEENPMHNYGAQGDYEIFLVAGNAFGCYDTTSLPIHVSADELLYIPNAITPNGDGKNDWFMPFGAGWSIDNYELRIYNRWGQLLFVTTDINKPWHGETLNTGEKVPTGVYVWKVWYVDLDGKLQKMIGRVTVYY
jgi:gliding motility-associated-like protein